MLSRMRRGEVLVFQLHAPGLDLGQSRMSLMMESRCWPALSILDSARLLGGGFAAPQQVGEARMAFIGCGSHAHVGEEALLDWLAASPAAARQPVRRCAVPPVLPDGGDAVESSPMRFFSVTSSLTERNGDAASAWRSGV